MARNRGPNIMTIMAWTFAIFVIILVVKYVFMIAETVVR